MANSRHRETPSIDHVVSRAWDSGNYANAYTSQNLARAWLSTLREMDSDERKLRHVNPKAFRAGFVLGFYSSYEDSEIPASHLDEVLEANAAYGKYGVAREDN